MANLGGAPRDWQFVGRLAFRSDTRHPREIFADGFRNRQHPSYLFADVQELKTSGASKEERRRLLASMFEQGPEYRDARYYRRNNPRITTPAFDVNPTTSVALTLRVEMAPIFPLLPHPSVNEVTWIYAVWLRGAFMTHLKQQRDSPLLADAEEVAVRYVAPQDVIAAVPCVRFGGPFPSAITYNMHGLIDWNSRAELSVPRRSIVAAFRPWQYRATKLSVSQGRIVIVNKKNEAFLLDANNDVTWL